MRMLIVLALAAFPATPRRTVVVVLENQSYSRIIGNPDAPYINALAAEGALFTNARAVARPSQPNYLALFSGSVHGVNSNTVPAPGSPFDAPNLAVALDAAGGAFAGYSEDLPHAGFTGTAHAKYVRRHNPWVNFSNVPAAANLPFTMFPADFSALPDVSFVIPNLDHDMHDGSVATADAWLRAHIDPFVRWALANDGLLILTWDEASGSDASNHIPLLFVGGGLKPGVYAEDVDHYRVLRTIESRHGLSPSGPAVAAPVVSPWQAGSGGGGGSSCGLLGLELLLLVAILKPRRA